MAIDTVEGYPGNHVFVSYVKQAYKDRHSSLDPESVHFKELEDDDLGLDKYPDFVDIFEEIAIHDRGYDSVCLQGTEDNYRIPTFDDCSIITRGAWLMREKGSLLRMIKGSRLEEAFRERWPLSWMLGGYTLWSASSYIWNTNGDVDVASGFKLYRHNGVLLLDSHLEYTHETARADPEPGEVLSPDRIHRNRFTSLEVEDGLARAVFEAIRYNSNLPGWR